AGRAIARPDVIETASARAARVAGQQPFDFVNGHRHVILGNFLAEDARERMTVCLTQAAERFRRSDDVKFLHLARVGRGLEITAETLQKLDFGMLSRAFLLDGAPGAAD